MAVPADTEAVKARIIKHMNNDHQDSLVRYLEYYCHLPSHQARNARLTALTLSSLHLSTSASRQNTYLVPLDPPLKSWSEIRERVVAMDKDTIAALGRSDITIKTFRRPQGFGAVVAVAVLITFIVFHRRSWFAPSIDPSTLAARFPRLFAFFWRIQPAALGALLTIHGSETVWLDRTRLSKHSVPRLSALWWKWMVFHFFEGYTSFKRFDAMVMEEKVKKEKIKH